MRQTIMGVLPVYIIVIKIEILNVCTKSLDRLYYGCIKTYE